MNEKLICDDSNLEPGSEKVVESMNLIDENQENQEDSVVRNKRSSEASEELDEIPVKKPKKNTDVIEID